MKHLQQRKALILLLSSVFAVFIIHRFYFYRQNVEDECRKNSAIIIRKNFKNVPKEMLTSETIYFLETHNSSDHELNQRQACAIESAAYMNPNANIFVLFLTPSNHIRLKNWPRFQKILDYKNVHLRYFHIHDIVKDTVVEKFLSDIVNQHSKWKVLHTSDTLRYALLHKYSGVYLDLDVINKAPLGDIESSNFACLEDTNSVNNAIIKLSGDDNAQTLGKMLLQGVISNFNGGQWSIGPRLLTKVVKDFCAIDDFKNSTECIGFTIMPVEKCYAVEGWQWRYFFQESRSDRVMDAVKNSVFVHLWNYQMGSKTVKTTQPVALNYLAAEYCPGVFETNTFI